MDRFKHITFIKDVRDDSAESSALALDMAVAIAAGNDGQRKTLLIEADLNKSVLASCLGLSEGTQSRPFAAANVLLKQITLNQAVTPFKGVDIILGNPYKDNLSAIPAGYFNIFKDDFALLCGNYKRVVVAAGDFPDKAGAILYAKDAGQALIITAPDTFAVTKAYEFILSLPKAVKAWLFVAGTKNENEAARTFISLKRAVQENSGRMLYFAASAAENAGGTVKEMAQKLAENMGLLEDSDSLSALPF